MYDVAQISMHLGLVSIKLYLKLIYVGDFKKTKGVMNTMYQCINFGQDGIVALLVVIIFILIHSLKALPLKSLKFPS